MKTYHLDYVARNLSGEDILENRMGLPEASGVHQEIYIYKDKNYIIAIKTPTSSNKREIKIDKRGEMEDWNEIRLIV